MGKEVIIILCLLLATVLLIGCKNKKGQENQDVKVVKEPPLPTAVLGQNKELEVKLAEEFVILADGNITTGFAWYYCGKETVDGVELKKNDYIDPKTNGITCGAPGVFQFVFEAKKAGRYELKFEYKRPWEKDMEPTVEKIVVVVE